MGFGNKLKEILKEKKMTIKELSELTGISLNTLYSITKRDTQEPDSEIVYKIASALNISVSELMTYEMFKNELNFYINREKEREAEIRKKLYEISEMLNSDALYELLDAAIEMLQDEVYRSIFFKKES